nr:hypothetical protein [Tanacetum cinerariifolium]
MDELPCSTQYFEANNLPRSKFIVTLLREFIEIVVVVKLLSLSLDDDNDDDNGNNDEELNYDNDDANGNNNEELNVDNEDGNNGEELNVDNDDGKGNKDGELNDINNDGNGNNDEELNDEDTLGGNPTFGFSKIGLVDFEKQPSQEGTDAEKESVDPTQKGTVVELNPAEYCEIMSTPENYTQWMEFSVGNSLFAMQGDKIDNVFETRSGGFSVYGIRLNLKTFTPGRLKPRIPKLKWRTSKNFHDCEVFTMLHMESFNGETASKWDCGLSVESGLQCDLLRRLRFKFATKILLHEINVHSRKMLELSNEFDKVDSLERMAIIVEAVKNKRNVIASNYLVTKNIFCCVIQGIDIESQEIDQESQEIHLESHLLLGFVQQFDWVLILKKYHQSHLLYFLKWDSADQLHFFH